MIGVAGPQLSAHSETIGVPETGSQQPDLRSALDGILRLEDNYSRFRDEIDGIYLQLEPGMDSVTAPR